MVSSPITKDSSSLALALPDPFDTPHEAVAFVAFWLGEVSFESPFYSTDQIFKEVPISRCFTNGDYLGMNHYLDLWVTLVASFAEGLDPKVAPNIATSFPQSRHFHSFPSAPEPLSSVQLCAGLFKFKDPFLQDAGIRKGQWHYLDGIEDTKTGLIVEAEAWDLTKPLRGHHRLIFQPGDFRPVFNLEDYEKEDWIGPYDLKALPSESETHLISVVSRNVILNFSGVRKSLFHNPPRLSKRPFVFCLEHWPFFYSILQDDRTFDPTRAFASLLQIGWSCQPRRYGHTLVEKESLDLEAKLLLHAIWSSLPIHLSCFRHNHTLLSLGGLGSSISGCLHGGWRARASQLAAKVHLDDMTKEVYPEGFSPGAPRRLAILGGAVVSCLYSSTSHVPSEDIDIFIVAPDPLPMAIKALYFLINVFRREGIDLLARVSPCTITLYRKGSSVFTPVQLVLVKGTSIEEALHSFDLDACQVGIVATEAGKPCYDVVGTSAAFRAWMNGRVAKPKLPYRGTWVGDSSVDDEPSGVATPRFIQRIAKYEAKGFMVHPYYSRLGLSYTPSPKYLTLDALREAFPSSTCCELLSCAVFTDIRLSPLDPLTLSVFDRSKLDTRGSYQRGKPMGHVLRLDAMNPLQADLLKRSLDLSDLAAKTRAAQVTSRRLFILTRVQGYPLPFGFEVCLWSVFRTQRFDEIVLSDHRCDFFIKGDDPAYDFMTQTKLAKVQPAGVVDSESCALVRVRFIGSVSHAFDGQEVRWKDGKNGLFRWPLMARVRCLVSGVTVQAFRKGSGIYTRTILTVDHAILYPACLSGYVW
jgi:hypothetical protein